VRCAVPRGRSLLAALVLTALAATGLPPGASAAADERADDAPAASLRAALTSGGRGLDELPRGETRRGASTRAALRGPAAPPPVRAAALPATDVSTISIRFVDTPGNAWSPGATAAFRAAADVWERTVESRVPIVVEAVARSLGPDELGGAGPFDYLRNEGTTVVPDGRAPTAAELRDDVFEPIALANARTGRDNAPPAAGELNPDIVAEFNPNLGGLYFGTDGRPPAHLLDFRTIVMHEIGHGLGLSGTAVLEGDHASVGVSDVNGDTGVRTGVSFDQFTYATTDAQAGSGGTRLLTMPDGSEALRQALTGGRLYWSGQQALTAARGGKVRLSAPPRCGEPGPYRSCQPGESPFVPGSSYSHLDESTYGRETPNALMTPYLDPGEAYADPGQIAMGLLGDMGYAVPALAGTRFTAVDPVRVLDTRTGLGARAGAVRAGGHLDLQVAGSGVVPADATAVVLNVTAVRPSAATDVRVYPTPVTASPVPTVSNLNLAAGETRANAVTVAVGDAGRVRLRNSRGGVTLLADLAGWYAPGAASGFTPADPVRLLDTRIALGAAAGAPVPGGGAVELQVAGTAGVPATATAVALTVTAVGASAPTDIRVSPGGGDPTAVPAVSSVNAAPGAPVPNLVVVKTGPGGTVRLRNTAGQVHLLADLAGWYGPDGSLFRAVAPARVLDTRRSFGVPPGTPQRLGPGQTTTLTLRGGASVPRTSTPVVLNVTGVEASAPTDVRVWPATLPAAPVVSNLNLGRGQTAADAVVVKTGEGTLRLRNAAGSVALVADAFGWFGPPT
jgi:hypothetical protein